MFYLLKFTECMYYMYFTKLDICIHTHIEEGNKKNLGSKHHLE